MRTAASMPGETIDCASDANTGLTVRESPRRGKVVDVERCVGGCWYVVRTVNLPVTERKAEVLLDNIRFSPCPTIERIREELMTAD